MTDSKSGEEIEVIKSGDRLSKKLNINKTSTVQPNVLLRAPVFTPKRRNDILNTREIELGKAQDLDLANVDGYERVILTGMSLSIDTDWRVWRGMVRVMSDAGYTKSKLELKFTKFAALCGFPSKKMDSELRERIAKSIRKIMSQVITFTSNEGKRGKMIHLVEEVEYDEIKDQILITPAKSLWTLYRIDRTTLLKLEILDKLKGSESAACLYVYLQSLPNNIAKISFERLRARLNLGGELKSQNRSVKLAIEKLEKIGYLTYEIKRMEGESYLLVKSRNHSIGSLSEVKDKLVDIDSNERSDDIIEGEFREIENELKTEDEDDI